MPKLSIEDLKKIKENAKKATALREGGATVKITVHMGTCGIAAGAREVMDSLLEEMAQADLVLEHRLVARLEEVPEVTGQTERVAHDPEDRACLFHGGLGVQLAGLSRTHGYRVEGPRDLVPDRRGGLSHAQESFHALEV